MDALMLMVLVLMDVDDTRIGLLMTAAVGSGSNEC